MQAKRVAPEILRDKALSLQQLKRLTTLEEEEEEEEEEELKIVKVTAMTATIKHSFPFAFPKREQNSHIGSYNKKFLFTSSKCLENCFESH
jgi:hypothetical protein